MAYFIFKSNGKLFRVWAGCGVSMLRIIYIEQGIVETILASQKQGAVVEAP